MPAKVTRYLKSESSKHFIDYAVANDNYYLFIGNTQDWYWDTRDEALNDPPEPIDGFENIDYDLWDRMVALKKIDVPDLSLVIPRVDWTSGTTYQKYKDNIDLFDPTSNSHYVVNSDFRVYKCIDNNKNSPSTVEPKQTDLVNTIITSDGYEWKYMYPIVGSDIEKFISSEYIPIKTVTSLDTFNADQYNIQTAATEGTVDSIDILTSGNNFINLSAYIKSYTNTTTIILPTNAETIKDQYYRGCNLFVETGDGSGQLRTISNYDPTIREVTFSTPLTVPLSNTAPNPSYVVIGPKVEILADGDAVPTAYANINPLTSNSINYINMIERGRNNTTATAIVRDGTYSNPDNLISTSTTLKPHISPYGGHGSNAVRELHNGDVMISMKLTKNEVIDFLEDKTFRTYGILENPRYAANDALCSETTVDNTVKLHLKNVAGLSNNTFVSYGSNSYMLTVGMVGFNTFAQVYESNTSAVAALDAELYAQVNHGFTISYVSNTATTGVLSMTSPRYKDGYLFLDEGEGGSGETVRLKHDGAGVLWPIDADGSSAEYEGIVREVEYPKLKKGSGKILYIENRVAIVRDEDQVEDLKMIITY